MGSRQLLRGATVLTMDATLGEIEADILIEDDTILEVGRDLAVSDAATRDLHGSIILPGLVDAHSHLWQGAVRGVAAGCWGREYFGIVHPLSGRLRPEDMYAATLGSTVEMLLSGTTTVFDFCHATNSEEHARSSLRGFDESGIRGIFGFCFRHRPEANIEGFVTLEERREVLQALASEWEKHPRVSLGVALNNIDHVSLDVHVAEVAAARGLGLVSSLHSNLPGQISESADRQLLGEDMLWVHAGCATTQELRLLGEHGGSIIVTPEVEAAAMGIASVMGRAAREGVTLALGTDVPSMMNGSLFEQMRIGRALSRVDDVSFERSQNRSGARTPTCPTFDSREVLRMATIDGARAVGLADQVGSITPGKKADLLVVSTEPFGLGAGTAADHVVLQATARHLTDVYVGGRLVVQNGRHQLVDTERIRRGLDQARDWVLGRTPESVWPEIDIDTRARYEAGQGKAD